MAHTPVRAASPVGSGAVGVGCQRLRLCTRPDNLAQKQALAAVGQVHLMRYYDDLFSALDLVGDMSMRTWLSLMHMLFGRV